MKVFATNQFIPDLDESSDKKALYGAWVATSDFYKNLIRLGNFDEYHFFVRPQKSDNKKRSLITEKIPYANNEKVRIESYSQLPLFLKNAKDIIFFSSTPAIFKMVHLRGVYAKKYFPICGLTHTVSYANLLNRVFFQNMLSDSQPFDAIICTSKSVLQSVRKINKFIRKILSRELSVSLNFKARLEHLPLGINPQDYIKNNKNESRKVLRLPEKKIIILYFGRFSILDKADLYPLLFVFKSLLGKNKNIFLVLAGQIFSGDYGQKVKKMANEMGIFKHTRFFFNPSQEQKYLLYAASDIFVSPSDNPQESFGLTVLEAMASGLPCIVSDWDGYKDTVMHNKTGFLIPTYWAKCDQEIANHSYLFGGSYSQEGFLLGQSVCIDIRKMVDYLSILIKRKELRLRFGHNARERILKDYDWSTLIPKYEAFWDRLSDRAKVYKAYPRKAPIFYPQYFKFFNHYPSYILNKKTHITITEEGVRFLKTREFPPGLKSVNLIRPQIIFLIFFYLKERHILSIERVEPYINKFFKDVDTQIINYHIMWMLKNYLLAVIPR